MVKEVYEKTYGRPWLAEDADMEERYPVGSGEDFAGFPGSPMPVVTLERQDVIQAYRFGMIPHWTAPERVHEQRSTFNARIETITELATWRDAWKKGQRCLVCTNGFFEHNKAEKRKMFVHLRDVECFYYAGLYNNYINRKTAQTPNPKPQTPNPLEYLSSVPRTKGIKQRMSIICDRAIVDSAIHAIHLCYDILSATDDRFDYPSVDSVDTMDGSGHSHVAVRDHTD